MLKVNNKKTGEQGFTLIEIMVSVSVFVLVMVVAMGSVFSVFDANRKSQTLRSVMDNLNLTLESMTRTIRFGTSYHCDITTGTVSAARDCSGSGAASIGVISSAGTQFTFRLVSGRIARTVNCTGGAGGCTDYYLTGSDVTITNLSFRVFGSSPYSGGADLFQPQVIVVISGYVGNKPTSKSTFTIQTTISQRLFDSQ